MPDRERKGVPDHGSNVLKGSLPRGPSAHPRNTEDASIREESEKESRDEATHGGMEELYQNNVEAAESYFVLNPAADW